jgi:hypothetical protein
VPGLYMQSTLGPIPDGPDIGAPFPEQPGYWANGAHVTNDTMTSFIKTASDITQMITSVSRTKVHPGFKTQDI